VRRPDLDTSLLVTGAVLAIGAAVAEPGRARAAVDQSWAPFVLVAGLLLVGVVAHDDGLFDRLGTAAGRVRAHPAALLVLLLGAVAVVTVFLNLDTSAAFLTPVLVVAARRRSIAEEPFLYGALLMSNAASLLLPGSNLTNLLVLAGEHVSGAVFAARMLPAWIASVVVAAAFVVAVHHRELRSLGAAPGEAGPRWRPGPGTVGVGVAAVVVLVLGSPAAPVLALGIALAVYAVTRRGLDPSAVWRAVGPASLAGVFGVAVALGTLARTWSAPAHLMAHSGRVETAAVGAVASVAVNNLPAAVLLGSRQPAHARALLLGLDLGPNLAVTGSLSALIWYRAARTVGARPSAAHLTRLGVVLVPVSIAAAALALWAF